MKILQRKLPKKCRPEKRRTSETEQMTGDDTADMEEDTTASDEDLIMDPTYQDPTANDITDGETTDWGSGEDDTPTVSPTPTPTLGPNELPDPNITEPENSGDHRW